MPAVLLTHHYTLGGQLTDHLDAFCVRGGIIYELAYAKAGGEEAQDRAFVLAVIATFGFLGSP